MNRHNNRYGIPVIGKRPGLHNLSPMKFLLLNKLTGSKLIADNLVTSAKSVEKLRVDLCDVHLYIRPIPDHERNLAYRMLRIGQSMGFTCGGCDAGVLHFKGPEGSFVYIQAELEEYPRRTRLTHISYKFEGDQNPKRFSADVGKDGSVLGRFVEFCEGIFGE